MLSVLAFALLSAGAPTLEQRVATVLPTVDEDKWLQIPWRLSLSQAREEAQRQGKPMFLWIMNGHPMGCT